MSVHRRAGLEGMVLVVGDLTALQRSCRRQTAAGHSSGDMRRISVAGFCSYLKNVWRPVILRGHVEGQKAGQCIRSRQFLPGQTSRPALALQLRFRSRIGGCPAKEPDVESVPETLERTAKALSTSINAVEKIGGAVSAVADAAEGTPRRSDSLFLKQELAVLIRLHSGLIVDAGIAYAREPA